MPNPLDQASAMAQLIRKTEPDAQPVLTVPELEDILNDHITLVWEPNKAYAVGVSVIPTAAKRNGNRYVVVQGGISDTTEPEWSAFGIPNQDITNGGVIFRENGIETEPGYNVQGAAWEAWNKKMAKASQLPKTPGIDMSVIYDRCREMRDSFEEVLIA